MRSHPALSSASAASAVLVLLALAACSSDPASSGVGGAGGAGGEGGDALSSSRASGPASASAASSNAASSNAASSSAASSGASGSVGSASASSSSNSSASASSSTGSGGGGALSAAKITEFYVDRALEGDKVEWIEIAAEPGASLDKVRIRHHRYGSPEEPAIPVFDAEVALSGTKVPASGYWSVGGVGSPSKHALLLGSDNFGLDHDGGYLQLYREDTGELLDAIGYGAAKPAEAPSPPDTLMFGSAAALQATGSSGKGKAVARKPGSDAGDNSVDFCVQSASPNAENPGTCL